MGAILLLGPGKSRARMGKLAFGVDKTEYLTVVDMLDYRADWEDAVRYVQADMRYEDWTKDIPKELFQEVHAYEVLNLLPGDEMQFFAFWRRVWDVMEPGGRVYATVPHWASHWVHAYPAPQRTYTPALLSYLDNSMEVAHKGSFPHLWSAPYCFKLASAHDLSSKEGEPQAFIFVLEKPKSPVSL